MPSYERPLYFCHPSSYWERAPRGDGDVDQDLYASFDCAACGEWVGTVFTGNPDKVPDIPARKRPLFQRAEPGKVFVSSFLSDATYACSDMPAMERALRQGNPRLAAQSDWEVFGFYCRRCEKAYCHKHWSPEVFFDPDYEGWYDCTRGTCPAGHRQVLND